MPSLYGTDVAVNPRLRNVARSFNGKTVNEVTVAPGSVLGRNGPDSQFRRVMDIIAERVTVIMVEDADSSGTFRVFIEGDFPVDDYNSDGAPVSLAAYMQAQINEFLGGSAASVTPGKTFVADDVVEDYTS